MATGPKPPPFGTAAGAPVADDDPSPADETVHTRTNAAGIHPQAPLNRRRDARWSG